MIFNRVKFYYHISADIFSFLKILNAKLRIALIRKLNIKTSISKDKIFTLNILINKNYRKIYIRTEDLVIFEEVFLRENYRFKNFNNITTIIDLGAHIGFTSLFIYYNFGINGKMICVEPSSSNFKLLELNLKGIPNVFLENYAISSNGLKVYFDESLSSYNYKISKDKSFKEIKTKTISSLVDKYHLKSIDFIKIDIEGSEEELFSDNKNWIKIVRNLAIEIHHNYSADRLNNEIKEISNLKTTEIKYNQKQLPEIYYLGLS
jgi:FkbM family methyltransferase